MPARPKLVLELDAAPIALLIWSATDCGVVRLAMFTVRATAEKPGPEILNVAFPASAALLAVAIDATLVVEPAPISEPAADETWKLLLRRPKALESTTDLERSTVTVPLALLAAPAALAPPPM